MPIIKKIQRPFDPSPYCHLESRDLENNVLLRTIKREQRKDEFLLLTDRVLFRKEEKRGRNNGNSRNLGIPRVSKMKQTLQESYKSGSYPGDRTRIRVSLVPGKTSFGNKSGKKRSYKSEGFQTTRILLNQFRVGMDRYNYLFLHKKSYSLEEEITSCLWKVHGLLF